MSAFTAAGRTWDLTVTVNTIRRVRALVGVDLMGAVGGDVLQRIASDPVLLVDVLFVCVKPQADAHGITAEAFGESMAGDVLPAAADAFMESLVSFFPNPGRDQLRRVLAAGKTERARMERELVTVTDQAIATLGAPSQSAPASPASTPAT
jgi:hypothetical protein